VLVPDDEEMTAQERPDRREVVKAFISKRAARAADRIDERGRVDGGLIPLRSGR
jgi:hypothetical protein